VDQYWPVEGVSRHQGQLLELICCVNPIMIDSHAVPIATGLILH